MYITMSLAIGSVAPISYSRLPFGALMQAVFTADPISPNILEIKPPILK
jgi:hypothetical protein